MKKKNDVWDVLSAIKTIEPSPGFRDALWAKIERVSAQKLTIWEQLFGESWGSWLTAASAFVLAIAVGVGGGMHLYNKGKQHIDPASHGNSLAISLSTFTAPYPPNSIEAWVINNTLRG